MSKTQDFIGTERIVWAALDTETIADDTFRGALAAIARHAVEAEVDEETFLEWCRDAYDTEAT